MLIRLGDWAAFVHESPAGCELKWDQGHSPLYKLSLSPLSVSLSLSVSLPPCLFLVSLPLSPCQPWFPSLSASPCLCLSLCLSVSLPLSLTYTHTPSWNASSLDVGGDWQRRLNHAKCMVSVTKRRAPRKDRTTAVQWSEAGLSREGLTSWGRSSRKEEKENITTPSLFSRLPWLGENHRLLAFTVWFCGLIEG